MFERGLDGSPSKAVLFNTGVKLQTDLALRNVDLDTVAESAIPAESRMLESTIALMRRQREASLHAWVMKPVVSTAGMRGVSRNKVEVLLAIPQ